ncbi:MAG TPA: hypothetical protein VM120_30150 [Bryobacteraceae bacterium]|nr:hypothetical protein [Bryobacteraceae bacterium]
MSFSIYLIGFVIMIVGLAVGANMLGISGQWIAVGVLVLGGLGVLLGVKNTRQRDPS